MVLAVVISEHVDLNDIRAGLSIISNVDDTICEVARPMGHEEQLIGVERQVEGCLCNVLEMVNRGNTVRVELPVRERAIVGDVDGVVAHVKAATSASESVDLDEHLRQCPDTSEHRGEGY